MVMGWDTNYLGIMMKWKAYDPYPTDSVTGDKSGITIG
jgi:hypothetical protein